MKNTESPLYVTREELDALTRVIGIALAGVELARARSGFADGTVAAQLEMVARVELPAPERTALKVLSRAFDSTITKHNLAENQRAHERGNAYHRIHS